MNASRDFLVEIGTEELPPKSLLNLSAAFADGVAKGLKDAGVAYKSLEAFATPRRLAVRVKKLIEQQPDRPLEKRGPPVKAAFDANGAPTQAALAFARGCGVEVSALEKIETPKGEWLVFRGTESGARTLNLLPGIVTASLDALPIAKRMRWGAGETQFVRPVHWVLMLWGKDVVDTEILGQKAGNLTYGHRFMAPKALRISSPASYVGTLLKRGMVMADVNARRDSIRAGVTAVAERLDGCRRHRRRAARRSHGPGRMAGATGRTLRPAVPRTAGRGADRHDAGAPALFSRARRTGEADALVHHRLQHRKPRPVAGDRRQ